MREALRDRRTLFVTLVLPIILWPTLMIGLGAAGARQIGKLQESVQKVVLAGAVPAELRDAVKSTKGLAIIDADRPDEALRAGRVQLVLRAEEGFEKALADGGTGTLRLLFDSASEASGEARRKAAETVNGWAKEQVARRLESRGIPAEYISPVKVLASAQDDVATPARRGASVFGRMLSFMLVLMVISGCFSQAVDGVAGEKERGTMETLLVSPASRMEIVLGKFLAVFAVTLATALGNIVSMAFTFGSLSGMIATRMPTDFHLGLGTAAVILALLLPLAALFSALALALSTLARSTKEANTYLAPLMVVTMPLAMVSLLPNVELTGGLASVPVSGAVLLFRDLMLAQGEPELLGKALPFIPVVLGTSLLAAALALRWAVWMFGREEVLFRDAGAPFSFGDLRPARRRPGSVPGPGGAMLLPAVALALTYALAMGLGAPTEGGIAGMLVAQQALLLGLVVLAIAFARLDPRSTLGLRAPRALPALGAVLLAVGSAAALPWLARAVGLIDETRGPDESGRIIEALLRGLDLGPLLLVAAVLPAIAEEALFRGWVLRGLRSQMSPVAAVLVSSAVFGAFHMEPERVLLTGLLGCALAGLALATGSIWPGVAAHALHNGITLAMAKGVGGDDGAALFGGGDALFGLGGFALAGVGLALALLRRPDSLPAAEPRG